MNAVQNSSRVAVITGASSGMVRPPPVPSLPRITGSLCWRVVPTESKRWPPSSARPRLP
jgi:hypothetical protein